VPISQNNGEEERNDDIGLDELDDGF